jgi:hypothetical protein
VTDRAQHEELPARHRRYCPTCGAQRGETVCHRCRSDLTALVRLERQADALRDRARRCYARGWYRQAAALADRALSLETSPDAARLAACAHLLSGDFAAAWSAWRRTFRVSGE